MLKVLSEPLRKAYLKRDQDLYSLSKEDTDVLIEYYEQMYSFLNMEWRLGRLDRNPVYYSLRIQQLMSSNVGQQYYEAFGRTLLSATEDYVGLRSLADSVYENHAGAPVLV